MKLISLMLTVLSLTTLNDLLIEAREPAHAAHMTVENGTLKQPRVSVTSFKRLERRKALKCGQSMDSYDERIVGGKIASIADFP